MARSSPTRRVHSPCPSLTTNSGRNWLLSFNTCARTLSSRCQRSSIMSRTYCTLILEKTVCYVLQIMLTVGLNNWNLKMLYHTGTISLLKHVFKIIIMVNSLCWERSWPSG